jgi:hypothetical protein
MTSMFVTRKVAPCNVSCASAHVTAPTTCMPLILRAPIFAGQIFLSTTTPKLSHDPCREQHSCSALCQSPGICQIETMPYSMDATFTGKYGAFQYTKVSFTLPPLLAILTNHLCQYSQCELGSSSLFCVTLICCLQRLSVYHAYYPFLLVISHTSDSINIALTGPQVISAR